MGSRTPKGKGQILGVVWPFESIGSLAAVYTKTAEPTEMLLGGGVICMGPRNCVLYEVEIPAREWAISGGCLVHSKALAVSAAVFAAKRITRFQ